MSGHRTRARSARISSAPTSLRFRQGVKALSESLERRTLLSAVNWDGGGDGVNWTDPLNWSTNALPGPADDVTISVAANPNVQVASGTQGINSLVTNEALTISAGSLSVAAASQSNAAFTLAGDGTLTGAGNFTANAALNWTGGTMTGTGSTTVAPGGTLSMASNNNYLVLARQLINNGTGTWTSLDNGYRTEFYGGTLTNNGTLTLDSTTGTVNAVGVSGVNAITNNGTLVKTGAGTAQFFANGAPLPFNNTGVVTVDQGMLYLANGGNSSTTVQVASGATLALGNSYTFAGGGGLAGAGTMNFVNGSYAFANNYAVTSPLTLSTATVAFNAAQTLSGLTLDGSGATLAGSGAVTVSGAMNWSGGTMTGTGSTTVAPGGTLSMASNNNYLVLARQLINNGTGTWTSLDNGYRTEFYGGTLTNNGTLTLDSTTGTVNAVGVSGVNAITNNGTLVKTGAGTAQFFANGAPLPFNNTGVVTVDQGMLYLANGGNSSTTVQVASGATLALGNSYTFAGGGGLAGAGTMNFVNGSYAFANNYAVTSPLTLSTATVAFNAAQTLSGLTLDGSGATLAGSGAVTVSGAMNWSGGTMTGTGSTTVAPGGTLSMASNNNYLVLARQLINNGTGTWTSLDNGYRTEFYGGTLTNNGTLTLDSTTGTVNAVGVSGVNAITNNGTLVKTGAGTAQFFANGAPLPFNNTGSLSVSLGTMTLASAVTQWSVGTLTAGTWIVNANATLNFPVGQTISTNNATVTLSGAASIFPAIDALAANGGSFALAAGRDFTTTSNLTNNGTLSLSSSSLVSVAGTFTQGPAATLVTTIAGTGAGTDFGQVNASGALTLAGTLIAPLATGFDPSFTADFSVVVGASRTGTFAFTDGLTPSGRLITDRYSATQAIVAVSPLAPATAPDLEAGSDSGSSNSDDITSDSTPTFSGSVVEGTAVEIYSDGNYVGTAPVVGLAYSVTASALGEGGHTITTKVLDAQGDKSIFSTSSLVITIDTVAPTVGTPDLDAASDSGSSNSDNITNDATPSFAGTAEIGTAVQLKAGATPVGSGAAAGGGWTITSSALGDGTYAMTATATDPAGNFATSAPLNVTVDTVAVAPGNPDLATGSDSGTSSTDNLTNDNTPTFDGTNESTATVSLYVDGVAAAAQTTLAGTYQLTATAMADGTRLVQAAQVDRAGNASPLSTGLSIVVDTAAPTAPSTPDLLATSDSGTSDSDDVTNDNTPSFSGTAGAGETVQLYSNGLPVGSAALVAAGTYQATTSVLPDGARTITSTATDAAGNVSVSSGGLVVTVDTVAPAAPSVPDLAAASDNGTSSTDNLTNDNTPAFNGTTTGSIVLLFADGVQVGAATASGGAYSVTATTLADGARNLTGKAVDAAGNVSTASGVLTVTIDTVAPGAPGTPDLDAVDDSGANNTDNITNATNTTFAGAVHAGTVRLLNSFGQVLGSHSVIGPGGYSIAVTLPTGVHILSAAITDDAGNAGQSGTLQVTIDRTGPSVIDASFLQGAPHAIGVTFTESIAPLTLSKNDLAVLNQTTNTTIAQQSKDVSYDDLTHTASFTFPGLAGGLLTDGTYRATVAANAVTDVAGNLLPLTSESFYIWAGGTGEVDVYEVKLSGANVGVYVNGSPTASFTSPLATLSEVALAGQGSNDRVTIDLVNGNPVPVDGIAFDGGNGSDTLAVVGAGSAETVVFNAAAINMGGTIGHSSLESIEFNGGGGGDAVTINAGAVTFTATQDLSSLTLAAGTSATLAAGGDKVLITDSLMINPSALLDLVDNDLILDYSGTSPMADTEDLVRAAYNVGVGDWSGTGITSSVAALDGNFVVAVADNAALAAPFGSAQGGSLFAGQDVDLTAVLVKFTHRADVDLDGVITPNDAAIFGGNYSENDFATWATGDMDYDGLFTPTDAAIFGGFYDESLPLV